MKNRWMMDGLWMNEESMIGDLWMLDEGWMNYG
jgi:hypothetical protein